MAFYRRWIVACAVGEFVGIGVAAGAALAMSALIGEPQSIGDRLLTLATFAAVGAVEGAALAGFQWRVRKLARRSGPSSGAVKSRPLPVAGHLAR